MGLAVDPVEDCVYLQGGVALDVFEAIRPGREVGFGIANLGAGDARRRRHSGKSNHIGVDFGRVEVVQRAGSDAGCDGSIRGVLVGPGRESAGGVNHAENAVDSHELPWIDRSAALAWVTNQVLWIDGRNGTVGQRSAGRAPVELGLVEVDPFFVLGRCASRRGEGSARAGAKTVARGYSRGIIISRVGDIIVNARGSRASACNDGGEARERVR